LNADPDQDPATQMQINAVANPDPQP
jgi:hypothetical protein